MLIVIQLIFTGWYENSSFILLIDICNQFPGGAAIRISISIKVSCIYKVFLSHINLKKIRSYKSDEIDSLVNNLAKFILYFAANTGNGYPP